MIVKKEINTHTGFKKGNIVYIKSLGCEAIILDIATMLNDKENTYIVCSIDENKSVLVKSCDIIYIDDIKDRLMELKNSCDEPKILS